MAKRSEEVQEYRQLLAISLGARESMRWHLPSVEELDFPQPKHAQLLQQLKTFRIAGIHIRSQVLSRRRGRFPWHFGFRILGSWFPSSCLCPPCFLNNSGLIAAAFLSVGAWVSTIRCHRTFPRKDRGSTFPRKSNAAQAERCNRGRALAGLRQSATSPRRRGEPSSERPR